MIHENNHFYNGDKRRCGLCEKLCPMKNIAIKDQKAVSSDRCTMCYRCVNKCPGQALTLLGKRVVEQCGIEKYI